MTVERAKDFCKNYNSKAKNFIQGVSDILLHRMFSDFAEFVETHIVTDCDDEPYKSINDIEVDAQILDNVPRHNQED